MKRGPWPFFVVAALAATSAITAPARAGDAAPAPAAEAHPPAPAARVLQGAVVVAPGAPEAATSQACRALAREVYKADELRPRISEIAASTLCGGPPGEDASAKKLAELRQALTLGLDSATSKLLAEGIADELGARALVLVAPGAASPVPGADGATEAPPVVIRVVRAFASERGKISVFIEKTRLTVKKDASTGTYPFDGTARAIRVLAEDEHELSGDGGKTAVEAVVAVRVVPKPLPGPRRDKLIGARATDAPKAPGDKPFYESPWFWVAAGSVAAVGLAVLIVSQTTDVGRGTVKIQGTVDP